MRKVSSISEEALSNFPLSAFPCARTAEASLIFSNTAQVLAEGIEDLQVSFACDTGSIANQNLTQLNGILDEGTDDGSKQSDEWWNNVPGDNLPAIGTLDSATCPPPCA